jgi:hypothetical protein
MMVSVSGLAAALPVESTKTIALDDGDEPIAPALCARTTPFAVRATATLATIIHAVTSSLLLADNDTARRWYR